MITVKQINNGCSVDIAEERNFVLAIYVIAEKINQSAWIANKLVK
jgi:hypothetical protein